MDIERLQMELNDLSDARIFMMRKDFTVEKFRQQFPSFPTNRIDLNNMLSFKSKELRAAKRRRHAQQKQDTKTDWFVHMKNLCDYELGLLVELPPETRKILSNSRTRGDIKHYLFREHKQQLI